MTSKTFKLRPEDLTAYQFAVRDRLTTNVEIKAWWEREWVRAAMLCVASAVVFLAVDRVVHWMAGRPLELPDFLLGAGVGAAFILGLVWMNYRDQRRRVVSPDGVVMAEHTLELTAGGLVSRQRHVESRYDWPVVLEITDQRELLIIWIEPGVGIAVPHHAFKSDGEREAFIAEVNSRRTASRLPRVGSFG